MTYREIWKAVVLSIVTFGVYAVVWQVKVKGELNSQGAEIPALGGWWFQLETSGGSISTAKASKK
jgi:hypothetical protein